MKFYCIALLLIAAVIAWLSFIVLPGKTVMTLEPIGENEALSGPVFGVLSSSSNAGKRQTEIVQRDEWRRVVDAQTGWGAVVAWWHPTELIFILGAVFGGLVGRWWGRIDAETEAIKYIGTLKTDLALTKASLDSAKSAYSRDKLWANEAEARAAAKIKIAENKATEATARSNKAEAQLREIKEKRRKSKEAP